VRKAYGARIGPLVTPVFFDLGVGRAITGDLSGDSAISSEARVSSADAPSAVADHLDPGLTGW